MSNDVVTKDESALQREAFEFYYVLGTERSYAKVAAKFSKSLTTIENWGKAFRWQARVEEREVKRQQKATEQAIIEKEVDFQQRNLKILKRGILEHAKAIQSGAVKCSYKTLIELIDAEQRIRTGVDKTIELRHRIDLRNLSNDEIQQKIDTTLNRILSRKEMKTIDVEPVDAEFTTVGNEDEIPENKEGENYGNES